MKCFLGWAFILFGDLIANFAIIVLYFLSFSKECAAGGLVNGDCSFSGHFFGMDGVRILFFVFIVYIILILLYASLLLIVAIILKRKDRNHHRRVKLTWQLIFILRGTSLLSIVQVILVAISLNQQKNIKENLSAVDCVRSAPINEDFCSFMRANNMYLSQGQLLSLCYFVGHALLVYYVHRHSTILKNIVQAAPIMITLPTIPKRKNSIPVEPTNALFALPPSEKGCVFDSLVPQGSNIEIPQGSTNRMHSRLKILRPDSLQIAEAII